MRESKLWFWHIITAVVILALLGLHMGIMHLSELMNAIGVGSGHPIESESVFHRSQQLSFMIIYILLLGAGLFHGLYGLRSMLFELSLSRASEKAIGGFCAVVGVFLFVYGTYAAVAVYRMGGVRP